LRAPAIPRDDPLASLVEAALRLPTHVILIGAGGFIVLGVLLLLTAVAANGRAPVRPTPTVQADQFAESTPGPARVDPTVAALTEQVAQIQATADAARGGTETTSAPTPRQVGSDAAEAVDALRSIAVFVATDTGLGSAVSLGGGRFVTNFHVVADASAVAV